MSDTKQKILAKSLELFNDCGISNVSLRDIADELGISIGNLQYHFKKREDIIEGLYYILVKEIDSIYFLKTDDLLASFLNISSEMIAILFKYRFFLLDFVAITRRHPQIKSNYAELSIKRQAAALEIVDVLIKNGLLREELLQDEYHNLYKRMEVLTNFWFSSIFIQSEVLSDASIPEYSLLVGQSIYPYLTADGKNQYESIFPLGCL